MGRVGGPLTALFQTQRQKILENRPVYAAPRMSQLRKSSSAASQSFHFKVL